MIQPSADIFYRIQNIDFGTYLDVPEQAEGENVESRLLKDSPKQWWNFKTQGGSNSYQILNRSTTTQDTLFALSVDWKDKVIYVEPADKCKVVWTISIPKVGDYCTISTKNPQRPTKLFLHMTKDGPTISSESRRDNQAWRILEVSPSPPADTYRIRNMDGVSVLTVHDNELAIHSQEYGQHQGWEVVPKGNGKCQIKKLDSDTYLGWEEGNEGPIPVKVRPKGADTEWIIKNIGGFAYSITALVNSVEYAVALIDETNIALQTKKNSYAQVWFFEPTKFVAAHDEGEDITRIPSVSERDYTIQNSSSSQYWSFSSNPARIGLSTASSQITLKYIDGSSPYFTLQLKDSSPPKYAVSWGDGIVVSNTPAVWYLQKEDKAPGYFICAAGKRRVARVITNQTKSDVNGQPMFTLGDKRAKDTSQMWKLA